MRLLFEFGSANDNLMGAEKNDLSPKRLEAFISSNPMRADKKGLNSRHLQPLEFQS